MAPDHPKWRRIGVAGVAALAVASCAEPPAHRPAGAVVTDSSGVSVVWSPAAMKAFESWSLAPEPEVRIGSAGGDPPYQLYRVTGAVRLADGDVVVANAGTNELRWYDSGGRFRFARGGAGQGPGEYRGLRSLLLVDGDSVLAEDMLAGTMHLYSAGGDLVRSWKIGALGPFMTPPPFARLDDGTFVALTGHDLSEPPGLVRSRMAVVRYRDGTVVDTVAQGPGGEAYLTACGPNGRRLCNWGLPFGLRALASAHGDRILTGNAAGYRIRVHDPSGKLVAIYRRDIPREPVTPRLLSRYVDSVVAAYPAETQPEARRAFAAAPVPDSLPSYTDLTMDAIGDTWVALPEPGAAGSTRWDVLGPDGAYLTTLEVPSDLEITQIGDDFLVGVSKDAQDVERVAVYRITKGM